MRRWIVIVLIAAGVLLLWGPSSLSTPHPQPPPATSPGETPAPSTPAPTQPIPAVDPTPNPAKVDSQPSAPDQDFEEGHPTGGFDPHSPPAGAPDTAQVQPAFSQATGYLTQINSYGYGDTNLNEFVDRARPFMTDSLYQEWNEIAELSMEEGADHQIWAEYQTAQKRHAATIGTPIVTRWTPTELELAVPYRAADVPSGGLVPSSTPERHARVTLTLAEGTWLVQQASNDF